MDQPTRRTSRPLKVRLSTIPEGILRSYHDGSSPEPIPGTIDILPHDALYSDVAAQAQSFAQDHHYTRVQIGHLYP